MDIFESKADRQHWHGYRKPVSTGEFLGIHTKLVLLDSRQVMSGSSNLDPDQGT